MNRGVSLLGRTFYVKYKLSMYNEALYIIKMLLVI